MFAAKGFLTENYGNIHKFKFFLKNGLTCGLRWYALFKLLNMVK